MAIDYSWSFRVYKQVDPCRLNFRPSKNTPLVAQVLSPASSFVTFSMYSITLYNCRTALDGGETTLQRFVNSAADPLWISKIFYLLKSSTVKLWSLVLGQNQGASKFTVENLRKKSAKNAVLLSGILMFQRFGAPQADAANGPISLASACGWRWPKPCQPGRPNTQGPARNTAARGTPAALRKAYGSVGNASAANSFART